MLLELQPPPPSLAVSLPSRWMCSRGSNFYEDLPTLTVKSCGCIFFLAITITTHLLPPSWRERSPRSGAGAGARSLCTPGSRRTQREDRVAPRTLARSFCRFSCLGHMSSDGDRNLILVPGGRDCMIDEEDQDIMQKSHEASLECLKIDASHYNPPESGNANEGFPKPKDELNVHPGYIVESDNSLNMEAFAPPNQGYNRPIYRQEISTWPNFQPDIQILRQNQVNPFENHFYQMNQDYTLPVENRVHYLPFKMFSQAYPHEVQFQEFQYFVVMDFEATCDKDKTLYPQEIIEFPSVLVNSATGQLEDSFQTYVRPAYHQLLTDYCKDLTGIQQIQVDRGVPLSEALLRHDKWLEDKGIKHKKFAVVTWGDWDCRVMLESECRFKSIRKPPYFNRWINLKVPFQEVFGGVRCNLKDAVQLAGLSLQGRWHCGLDDARNTARLLALLMSRGFRFSITNSLWQSTDPVQQHQKPKELPGIAVPSLHPFTDPAGKEKGIYCYCGVMSSKCVVRKPGPTQGRCFFGCGNWTAARRAVCNYFVWVSP